MAKPASIIVANWRVKMTRSCSATLPPEVLPFLPIFSWMDTTSRLRFSSAAMAACSVAASTELRISRPVPFPERHIRRWHRIINQGWRNRSAMRRFITLQ